MKMIYENWSLKIFPGFYDSFLTDFSSRDWEIKNKSKYYFDIRNSERENFKLAMAELWMSEMANSLFDNPIGLKFFRLNSVWSPSEYNFYTDKLDIDVKFDLRALKDFCFKQNGVQFSEYLERNWTSRDGFWSFVPDHIWDFRMQYKANKNKSTLIQIMLEFYLLQKINFEEVEFSVFEKFEEVREKYTCLVDSDDYSEHDYVYNDDGYEVA